MAEQTAVAELQEGQLIQVLAQSLYPGASVPNIKMVLEYCRAAKLDPMQKPVHIVPMWDRNLGGMRDVIMPGIGLYRIQAARSGRLAGISEPEFGPDIAREIGGQMCHYPEWCKVIVRRELPSGTIAEFTAIEYWMENYAVKGGKEKSIAPNAMWTKRPRGQLAKCAQAQALRMAFPEIGAAPTAEEMEGKTIEANLAEVSPEPSARPAREPYPKDRFEKNFPTWSDLISSGKKTAAQVIAMVESKAVLSEEQRAAIQYVEEVASQEDAE